MARTLITDTPTNRTWDNGDFSLLPVVLAQDTFENTEAMFEWVGRLMRNYEESVLPFKLRRLLALEAVNAYAAQIGAPGFTTDEQIEDLYHYMGISERFAAWMEEV